MLNLSKFIENPTGRIVMSIILGFGLSSLFKMSCKDKNCIIYKSPDLINIKGNIYSFNGECYKYSPKEVKCDKTKRIINA
jgi:hypothetical protein